MQFRSPTIAAAFIAGSLCFSHAAPAAKPQPQTGAAAPSQQPKDSMGNAMPGSANPEAGATKPSDAEIVATVLAVDSNEIGAAEVARKKKGLNKEVEKYAKMLHEQHKEDAKKYHKFAKKEKLDMVQDQEVKDLRSKGSDEATALSSKDGKEFEKAYIDAMVQGHTEALETIDGKLIPNARNPELKKMLNETRGHVSAHLEQGKRLQGAQASKAE
jgi:putative membrane protein